MPYRTKPAKRYSQRPLPGQGGKPPRPQLVRRKRENRQVEASRNEWESIGREPSEFRRKILTSGYIADRLSRDGVKTYLVGGEAVEVYTSGQFITGDIDLVVSDREKAVKLLESLGFTRTSRVWVNENLNLTVDIVGTALSGSEEKTRTLKVAGYTLKVAGIEDLIIGRLTSYKYWKTAPQTDLEQALTLLANYREELDTEYLNSKAADQKVADVLNLIVERSKQLG